MGTPRRDRREEAGFTIVEQMVTSAILLLIVTATMATLRRQEWRPDGSSAGTLEVLRAVTPPGAGVPFLFSCDVLQGSDAATGTPVPWQVTVTVTVDLTDPGATYSTQTQVQLRNLQIPRPS